MKISFISSLILFLLSFGAKTADFNELFDKIIKTNFSLDRFCSKDGPIREYDGRFCERSDGVAAFILLVCRDKIVKSHCHFKAGQRMKKAHSIAWLANYDVYKTTSEKASIMTDLLKDPKHSDNMVSDINTFLQNAANNSRQGDRMVQSFCEFLKTGLQAGKKKYPGDFERFCILP